MGKSLKYGEFTFPKSDVTYVRGYARGGKVGQAKVSKVMHEFGEGKLHSGSKSGPVVKSRKQAIAIGMSEARKASGKASGGMVGAPAHGGGMWGSMDRVKQERQPAQYAKGGRVKGGKTKVASAPKVKKEKGAPAPMDGAMSALSSAGNSMSMPAGTPPMMKVGGEVKKASMSMNPKSKANLPPRKINVKARMSLGTAGSPENLKHGGKVKHAYSRGGSVHPDLKEDKALIKRAFGMHDTQLHEPKRTDLSGLRRGGMATVKKYSHGGKVKNAYAHGGHVGALAGAGMGGGLGQMAGKKPVGGTRMNKGGVMKKAKGGMCK